MGHRQHQYPALTLTGTTILSIDLQSSSHHLSFGENARSNSLSTTATGKNTTTSLTIARPFPGVTNTQMTIVLSTTSGIASGNVIRVLYPTGFFISPPPPPQVGTCVQVDSYVFGASGLGPCSSVSAGGEFGPASIGMSRVTYSGNRKAADAQTLIFNGVTLSGAAVVIAMRTRSCAAPTPPPHPLRRRKFLKV
jgi:hypothetical protein